MSRIATAAATLLISIACVAQQQSSFRTWRAAEGGYTVEAKLIDTQGEAIVLEKTDGQRITVELQMLSEPDRRYVAESGGSSFRRPSARNSGEMDYRDVVILRADRPVPWQPVEAGSLATVELAEPTVFPVDGEVSAGPNSGGLIADPQGSKLLLISGTFRSATGRVFDLIAGKPIGGSFSLPGSCAPVALSADSKSLIVVPARGGRGSMVWLAASSSGTRERLTWRYSTSSIAEISMAQFVDDGLLLTSDTLGIISLWDLSARTLLWQIESQRGCVPAVSFDRKTLISCNKEFLFQVNLHEGQVTGCVPMRISSPNCFGFTPSGDEVVCVSSTACRRIGIANAETREHWNLMGGFGNSILGWVGDGQFLLRNHRSGTLDLIDLRLRGKAWWYQVRTVGGAVTIDALGRVWSLLRHVKDGVSYSVEGNQLPHQIARQWIEQQRPDDFVLLRPGDAIHLDVSAVVYDASPAQLEEIARIAQEVAEAEMNMRRSAGASGSAGVGSNSLADALKGIRLNTFDASARAREIVTEKIAASGLLISPTSPYTLHVEIGHPDQVTVVNQPPPGVAVPTHRPLPYSLKLHTFLTDQQGKVIWKSGSQVYAIRGASDSRRPTTGPSAVEYLQELDIPGTFVDMRPPGYSIILAGEIDDQEYK